MHPSAGTALQILRVLLEHPDQIITREQLRQRVWPSDTFVDFDHGINNAIKRLPEALGDTAETRYIETLPRRGYRFIGRTETATSARVREASPGPALPRPGAAHELQRLRNGLIACVRDCCPQATGATLFAPTVGVGGNSVPQTRLCGLGRTNAISELKNYARAKKGCLRAASDPARLGADQLVR